MEPSSRLTHDVTLLTRPAILTASDPSPGSGRGNGGWLSTLISVVVGLGDVVVTAYMYKGSKENVEKIKVGSSNENYP